MLEEAPTVGDGAVHADELAAIKKRKLAACYADESGGERSAQSTNRKKDHSELDGEDMDSETELLYAQAIQEQECSDTPETGRHPQKRAHVAHPIPPIPMNMAAWPAAAPRPSRTRSKVPRRQPTSPRETQPGAVTPPMERYQSRQPHTPNVEPVTTESSLTRTPAVATPATHQGWAKCVHIETLKLSEPTCSFFQAPSRAKADIKQKFAVETTKLKPYLQHLETLFSANSSQTTNQAIKSDLTSLKKIGTTKVDKRLGQEGKDNSFSVKCGHIRTLFESGRDLRAACLVSHQHLL